MSQTNGSTTWWACAVTEPKNRPELRLAAAIELAAMCGVATDTVYLRPAAASETRPPAGVTVVADEHVPANQFRFVRDVTERPSHG